MVQSRIDTGTILLGTKSEDKPDEDWLLSIGHAINRKSEEVKFSSSAPHVMFVCGARGSGKSYTLGVLAEEIAKNNSDIATVILDPIGVFWSMKYPNKEEAEVKRLKERGIEPKGMDNVQVFVPTGYKSSVPNETYDTDFSFNPSDLKPEDWCLTFGIDRYSPQGLLLERAVENVKEGYTREMGDKLKGGTRDEPPRENFSIEDLVECINHDRELLSKDKGFNANTRRALSSRLKTAKDWGIFGKEKKLSDIIKPGKVSVIDISFLSDKIGSLVLGILARKILSTRKADARKEAIEDMKGVGSGDSSSIPPVWLMVDEAHSFAPSSGKTAATDPLVEYVKQGRRPGLSAVLSTQQPSALNSKIISQLDVLISHRLSFEQDIKEVRKRMPTTLPDDLKEAGSLKKLSEGTAVIADEETNRNFVVSIRPRLSQHEGREMVTKDIEKETEPQDFIDFEEEVEVESQTEVANDYQETEEDILAVPFKVEIDQALETFEEQRKHFLHIFWPTEEVIKTSECYYPIWAALVDYYPSNGNVINVRVQMDALTGELLKKTDGKITRTNGVRKLSGLDSKYIKLLFEMLGSNSREYNNLNKSFKKGFSFDSAVDSLIENGLIERYEKESESFLKIKDNISIPPSLSEDYLLAAEDMPEREPHIVSSGIKVEHIISEEKMLDTLRSFGEVEIIEMELFYYPYWVGQLSDGDQKRMMAIDGVTGKRDEYAERMLRHRINLESK